MIKSLSSLTEKLKPYILENRPFTLSQKESAIEITEASAIDSKRDFENVRILSEWVRWRVRFLDLFHLPNDTFQSIRDAVDLCYHYGKALYQKSPDSAFAKEEIMARLIALKLGGQIPYQKLLEEDYGVFYRFVKQSKLHHKLFAMRLPLLYSEESGPMLPFEIDTRVTQYLPWRFFEKSASTTDPDIDRWHYNHNLLFTTCQSGALSESYSCHRWGIKPHHPFKETKWLPFDKRDPNEWSCEYRLEINTTFSSDPDDDPPFMLGIHAYLNLKNPKGEILSVGQDMLEEYKTSKNWEVLSRKVGSDKIEIPDAYEFYPRYCRHFRRFTIVITEEQYEKIIELVEAERADPKRWASVCQGNCVSFVLHILKKCLHIKIDASFHGLHVYFRQYTPFRWYRRLYDKYYRWYGRLSTAKKRALLFFPLYYLFTVVLGTIATCLTFNNFGKERDFTIFDVFFRPWKIACHHPLKLYLALKEAADKNGMIRPEEKKAKK